MRERGYVESVSYGPDGKIGRLVIGGGSKRKTLFTRRDVLDRKTVKTLKRHKRDLDEFSELFFTNPELTPELLDETMAVERGKYRKKKAAVGAAGMVVGGALTAGGALPAYLIGLASGTGALLKENPYESYSREEGTFCGADIEFGEPGEEEGEFDKHLQLLEIAEERAEEGKLHMMEKQLKQAKKTAKKAGIEMEFRQEEKRLYSRLLESLNGEFAHRQEDYSYVEKKLELLESPRGKYVPHIAIPRFDGSDRIGHLYVEGKTKKTWLAGIEVIDHKTRKTIKKYEGRFDPFTVIHFTDDEVTPHVFRISEKRRRAYRKLKNIVLFSAAAGATTDLTGLNSYVAWGMLSATANSLRGLRKHDPVGEFMGERKMRPKPQKNVEYSSTPHSWYIFDLDWDAKDDPLFFGGSQGRQIAEGKERPESQGEKRKKIAYAEATL